MRQSVVSVLDEEGYDVRRGAELSIVPSEDARSAEAAAPHIESGDQVLNHRKLDCRHGETPHRPRSSFLNLKGAGQLNLRNVLQRQLVSLNQHLYGVSVGEQSMRK
jgi:hypothetical protein